MPIVLFALAGAMLFGGYATLDRAKRDEARREALRRQEFEATLLSGAIDVAELRRQAVELGLDPDQVIAGAQAMVTQQLDVNQVMAFLEASS